MPTTLYTNDFESATLGASLPAFAGGTVISAGGSKAYGLATSADGDILALSSTGVPTAPTDQEILCRCLSSPSDVFSPVLRYDAATGQKIFAYINVGSARVFYQAPGGSQEALDPGPINATFSPGDWVWMRFQVIGSTVRLRTWITGPEPSTWDQTGTVSAVPGAGRGGLRSRGIADQVFDDITYTSLDSAPTPTLDVTPPTASATAGGSAVAITATRANASGALAASVSGGGTLSTAVPTSGVAFTWTPPGSGSGTATVTVTDATDSLTDTCVITYTSTPVPTLDVQPPTATATSGGSAVSITATRTNSSAALAAAVSGGGTLSTAVPTSGTPFTWTPPSSGSGTATVTVTDATDSLTDTCVITYSAAAGVTIANSNANLRYVGRWNAAKTINTGSSMAFRFSASSCRINFDVSGIGLYPVVRARLDGILGDPVQLSSGTTSITLTPALNATTTPRQLAHTVELYAEGISESNSWTTQDGALKIASLTLAAGGSMLAPPPARPVLQFVGDSITATVRYGWPAGPGDQGDMSGSLGYPMRTADALGYDCYPVGFGATDVMNSPDNNGANGSQGSGGVPNTVTSYPLCWSGQSVADGVHPDAIVVYLGTNSRAGDATAYRVAYRNLLGLMRTTHPDAAIVAVVPNAATALAASIAGAVADRADARIICLNYSNGVAYDYVVDTEDNIHPNPGGHDKLATKLAGDVGAILAGLADDAGSTPATGLAIVVDAPTVGVAAKLTVVLTGGGPLSADKAVTLASTGATFGSSTVTITAGSTFASTTVTYSTAGSKSIAATASGLTQGTASATAVAATTGDAPTAADVAAAVWAASGRSLTDKAGFALSATGLDAISVADPGPPSNHTTLPRKLVALWRNKYRKVARDADNIRHYADDGTTVNATQAISDDGEGNQSIGAAT